jgi:gamma-D-glutamyl-L-lysine dipeptidyl-peptidase
MQYGICNLSVVPLRLEPSPNGELISQLLYGDFFKVIEQRKQWSKIRLNFDDFEGWIDNKQYKEILKTNYTHLSNLESIYSTDLVEFVQCNKKELYPIIIGSNLKGLTLLNHSFEGHSTSGDGLKENIINTAFLYLNTPFLLGGKTPFGIDSSGFTQMVYKLNGFKLLREITQQSSQGEALSFIEESEAGDLAFFDNKDGEIVHVGIILKDNYIIHAYGKVRIDRIDQSGIYNTETNTHTHKLRVIKKIV